MKMKTSKQNFKKRGAEKKNTYPPFKAKPLTKKQKITEVKVGGIEPQKSKKLFDITPPPIKPGLFNVEPIKTDVAQFMNGDMVIDVEKNWQDYGDMVIDVEKNWQDYVNMETHPLNAANRKPKYELDIQDLNAVAERHGITPKQAYAIFMDVQAIHKKL